MTLPISLPFALMETLCVLEIRAPDEWQYTEMGRISLSGFQRMKLKSVRHHDDFCSTPAVR